MNEWQDMPEWLNKLVRGRPSAVDVYRVWEDVWKPELAKRGVTPDMLQPIGPEDRPTGIGVRPPGQAWAHGRIDYDDDEPRVLDALNLLVHSIDSVG